MTGAEEMLGNRTAPLQSAPHLLMAKSDSIPLQVFIGCPGDMPPERAVSPASRDRIESVVRSVNSAHERERSLRFPQRRYG